MRFSGQSGGPLVIAGAKFKSQIDSKKSRLLLTHARKICVILRSGCATKQSHLHLLVNLKYYPEMSDCECMKAEIATEVFVFEVIATVLDLMGL